MKRKLLFFYLVATSLAATAQTNFQIDHPQKIADYTYGELDLKVVPFGLGKEIDVGKILADGSLVFNWPVLDSVTVADGSIFLTPLKSAVVGFSGFCEDSQIIENTNDVKVVDTQFIYVYKGKRQVGVLFPATDKALMKNEPANIYSDLKPGSTISWFYSAGDANFVANCSEKKEWEGKYNFTKTNEYNIKLKKGWNIVQYTLAEIEEFKDGTDVGKLEKKVIKKTRNNIPSGINWYIKTFVKLD